MRIGVDARVLMDKYYSGVSEYAFCLLQALLAQDKDNQYVLFYNSVRNVQDRVERFSQANVSYQRWRIPNKLFNYGFLKVLKQPRLDKVMKVNIFFAPHINFFAFSKAAKSVLTIHDLSFYRYPQYFSGRKNFWHKALAVKKIINLFAYIVAVSQNSKNDIKELTGRNLNIEVIYSGINPQFFQPISQANQQAVRQHYDLPPKFVLFLGTIEPRKNVYGLIKAYETMRQEFRELGQYKLVIAGSFGWKFKPVRQAWQNSAYKDDIIFLNYVAGRHKPALYSLADLFVYPSFYEGFGFPPLEAAACGTPSVVSAVASLSEVMGQASLLVNPFAVNEIAQAMAQVLLNQDLADKLRYYGLKQAKKFHWAKAASQYLSLFKKI